MRPTKKLVSDLGARCLAELQKRERPDDEIENNLAVVLWNAKHTELFLRDGTKELDRALRKAIDAEGR